MVSYTFPTTKVWGTDKQDDDRNHRHLGIELVSLSMIRMRSDKKKAASITWRRHCLVLLTQNNQTWSSIPTENKTVINPIRSTTIQPIQLSHHEDEKDHHLCDEVKLLWLWKMDLRVGINEAFRGKGSSNVIQTSRVKGLVKATILKLFPQNQPWWGSF